MKAKKENLVELIKLFRELNKTLNQSIPRLNEKKKRMYRSIKAKNKFIITSFFIKVSALNTPEKIEEEKRIFS
jgi:hypothetical protein